MLRKTFIVIFLFFLVLNSLIIGLAYKQGSIKNETLLTFLESGRIQEEKEWQAENYLEAEPLSVESGMITFLFDDGHESVYKDALPILEKYEMVGEVAIVTGQASSSKDNGMTWEQIRRLYYRHWEILSHTVAHSNLFEVPIEKANFEIIKSRKDLESHGLMVAGFVPTCPIAESALLDEIKEYYPNCVGCEGLNNVPLEDPYLVAGLNADNIDMNYLQSIVNDAQEQNKWIIFIFHRVDCSGSINSIRPEKFEEIVEYISLNQLQTVTISQGIKAIDGR